MDRKQDSDGVFPTRRKHGRTTYDKNTEAKFAVKVVDRVATLSGLSFGIVYERAWPCPSRNYYYYNNYSAEITSEKPPLFAKQSLGEQPIYLTAIKNYKIWFETTKDVAECGFSAIWHMAHVGSHLRWEKLYDPHAKLNYCMTWNGNIRWDDDQRYVRLFVAKGRTKEPGIFQSLGPRTHSHYFFNNWAGTSHLTFHTTGSQKWPST